jgi:hypothetical protein
MKPLSNTPIEAALTNAWRRINPAYRTGFFVAAFFSVLAFGFEMTNLTLHHDDLNHLMVQQPLVGYYLGRFVHSWLFFYVQQGHFAPFLDMAVGMALMCAYGVLVAHLWGARRSLDVALVAAIVCVFPYMAQVYQYNAVMIAYPLAHLLVAAGVTLAVRGRALSTAFAAASFFVAFSIYQAVLANAVTIFLVWLLSRTLFATPSEGGEASTTTRSTLAVGLAVVVGGILHVLVVSSLNIPFDAAQGADKAFSLRSRLENGLQLSYAASEVLRGSRAFFVWPEAYLPQGLKLLQAAVLGLAALCCVVVPRGFVAKAAALVLLGLITVAPRTLQFLHPSGSFHHLTLTSYALVVAGAVMVIARSGGALVRNGSLLAGLVLVAGYVAQCNWISTVSHLNTQAHISTLTQILARVRSLPSSDWDGRTIIVVGEYKMDNDFPFRPSTGVASTFMRAYHMDRLARLLRDEARFVALGDAMQPLADAVAGHPAWPHPDSVGTYHDKAFVVLSKP